MTPYLIYIPSDTYNKEALTWLFRTGSMVLNLKKVKVDDKEIVGHTTIRLDNEGFYSSLSKLNLSEDSLSKKVFRFNESGCIVEDGKSDELLTAFYLINSLQEYNSNNLDSIGRFKYELSYQKRFNKIEENFAATLFKIYFNKYFPAILDNSAAEPSTFFLSHDIDSLYGAILQDGKAALKGGRFDIIAKLILNAILLKPDWFNINKIIDIENEYDLKSTFFWLVNKGRVNKHLTNSDYDLNSQKVRATLSHIKNRGNYIGLHKSISNETFNEEILKLNKHIVINRNHYLKFSLPKHYHDLESSNIRIDCSMGFAEHHGFRNSIGIPFVPFNLVLNKPHSFLEVPLNVMDGTFQKYMNIPPEEASRRMISFIENNKINAVISVLWHNHFFSSHRFKGYFEPYKSLLTYIQENKFNALSPGQLFNRYFHLK